jgi:hypothetical protein
LGKVACGFVVLREDDAAAIRPAAVKEKFLEPDKLGNVDKRLNLALLIAVGRPSIKRP